MDEAIFYAHFIFLLTYESYSIAFSKHSFNILLFFTAGWMKYKLYWNQGPYNLMPEIISFHLLFIILSSIFLRNNMKLRLLYLLRYFIYVPPNTKETVFVIYIYFLIVCFLLSSDNYSKGQVIGPQYEIILL